MWKNMGKNYLTIERLISEIFMNSRKYINPWFNWRPFTPLAIFIFGWSRGVPNFHGESNVKLFAPCFKSSHQFVLFDRRPSPITSSALIMYKLSLFLPSIGLAPHLNEGFPPQIAEHSTVLVWCLH